MVLRMADKNTDNKKSKIQLSDESIEALDELKSYSPSHSKLSPILSPQLLITMVIHIWNRFGAHSAGQ